MFVANVVLYAISYFPVTYRNGISYPDVYVYMYILFCKLLMPRYGGVGNTAVVLWPGILRDFDVGHLMTEGDKTLIPLIELPVLLYRHTKDEQCDDTRQTGKVQNDLMVLDFSAYICTRDPLIICLDENMPPNLL